MTQQRNSNIEILRFVLMAFILIWHIIIHGYDYLRPNSAQDSSALLSFCCALFSPAVYCFMLISGWYGIRFSVRKYAHLAFMAVVCFVLSMLIKHFWGGVSLAIIVEFIFPIACHFWWFLTCYVMVFLIAPFINLGFEQLDSRTIKQIIYIMTFMEVACLFNLIPNMGSTFYGLLYIYCLGRFLRRRNGIIFSRTKIMLAYILALGVLWISVYEGHDIVINNARLSAILLSYNNPCVIIMAVCLFLFVQKLKPTYHNRINKILSDVLVIYLLTEGIGEPLYTFLADSFRQHWLFGSLAVFLTMCAALLTGKLITQAFKIASN